MHAPYRFWSVGRPSILLREGGGNSPIATLPLGNIMALDLVPSFPSAALRVAGMCNIQMLDAYVQCLGWGRGDSFIDHDAVSRQYAR